MVNPNRKVQPTIFNGFIVLITIIAIIAAAILLATTNTKDAFSQLPAGDDFKKIAKPTMPNTTNTFLTYRNENFTVQYPAGYLIDEIENTTTQLRIYAALDGKLAQVFEIINYENAGYTQTIDAIVQELKQNTDVYNNPTQTTQTNHKGKEYTLISTTTKIIDEPTLENEPLKLNWAIYQCGRNEDATTYAVQTAIPQSQNKDSTTAQFIIDSFQCTQ